MSSYLMSEKINDLEQMALAGTFGGCQNVIGNDTAEGGYRVIVPDPDECGTIVRAIAPGDGMSISIDNTTNIMTLNSAVGSGGDYTKIDFQQQFNTISGGGNIKINPANFRLRWDGIIRIMPIRTTDGMNGRVDITMPPSGTRIPAYISTGQIGTVLVNDDGLSLIHI